MTILKTLTGVIDTDETTITLSDSSINNNSVIDVYFSSEVDSYDIDQIGTGVTVTISAHSLPVGVALVINNVDSVDYPITAENVSYFDSNVKLELLEHRSELNGLGNAIGLLDTEKQNTLIAGDNITIENDVISSRTSGIEYSNIEKIIGKFLNDVIYNIIVIKNNDDIVTYDSWFDTGIDITNIDKIISISGIGSTGSCYDLNAYHNGNRLMVQTSRNNNNATVKYYNISYTKGV